MAGSMCTRTVLVQYITTIMNAKIEEGKMYD